MRHVRNFGIEAVIDGRASRLRGGPRAREGALCLRLYQRDEGEALLALELFCSATVDGVLRLHVSPKLPTRPALPYDVLSIETRR